MPTVLAAGDIAIINYNSDDPDAFAFVFLRDVEAGTTINFTDNGWQAAGGFRADEGTATYTAPTDIVAVTNEVGCGLVAEHRSGRVFVDLLGWVNAEVAALSDEVVLVVSGRALHL